MAGSRAWALVKDTVNNFIADEALSRGASIAYYTLFAIGPVLLIIIAVTGLVFGRTAAETAIVAQLSALMGESTGKALEEIVRKVGDREDGVSAVATYDDRCRHRVTAPMPTRAATAGASATV